MAAKRCAPWLFGRSTPQGAGAGHCIPHPRLGGRLAGILKPFVTEKRVTVALFAAQETANGDLGLMRFRLGRLNRFWRVDDSMTSKTPVAHPRATHARAGGAAVAATTRSTARVRIDLRYFCVCGAGGLFLERWRQPVHHRSRALFGLPLQGSRRAAESPDHARKKNCASSWPKPARAAAGP